MKDIMVPAIDKAKGEASEEAGVEVVDLTIFKKLRLGARVEWDLYMFESTNW